MCFHAFSLSFLQKLPDRMFTKALDMYNTGHSVSERWHAICAMHHSEMHEQGTRDYRPNPCSHRHLTYLLTQKVIVQQQKGYAHEATEFIAYLEEKSRHEEIIFDWCPGPSGELNIAMCTTPRKFSILMNVSMTLALVDYYFTDARKLLAQHGSKFHIMSMDGTHGTTYFSRTLLTFTTIDNNHNISVIPFTCLIFILFQNI